MYNVVGELTFREGIPEAVKCDIEAITGINYAEIDRSNAATIDTVPMASCFVYAGPETRVTGDNEATLGFETWDLIVVVELWARKTDLEHLLGEIHRAIENDRYLIVSGTTLAGGRLLSGTGIKRMGADPRYFEADNERKVMVITFEARYRHEIGNMFIPI